jgi:4-oxalocrotonate tautomerase
MPEVIVHIAEGREPAEIRAMMKDITDAVAKNLNAKPETVTVSVIQTPKSLKMKGGVLFSER